jgi:hypothetical protein
MFSSFKRLSKGSRSNSYHEDFDRERPRSQDYDAARDSPPQSTSQHNSFGQSATAPAPVSPLREKRDMYPRSAGPQDPYAQRGVPANGANSRQNSAAFDATPAAMNGKVEQMPDLLTRAFNEAVRPYTDKIDLLESQMADLQAWVETLEQQRNEMYAWVDKRGLRPGKIATTSRAENED